AGDELLATADSETALGLPRLTSERGRTVNQLRLFAAVVREGSWVDARIDTADPARTPPKPDVRRLLVPMGPVAVFAASNFPLAFSVAGGDTASALAAGNPVVVKAHPAHPRTSDRVAAAVQAAARRCGIRNGTLALVHGASPEVGMALVRHPLTRAVGFTGSLRGGRALFDAASARPEPIPVYAEMGSTNPVFVLSGALEERGAEIATALGDSVTLGVGQFCTKPGLIFAVDGPACDRFAHALAERIEGKPAARMLYPALAERFAEGIQTVERTRGVRRLGQAAALGERKGEGDVARPVAWHVGAADFLTAPALREETFGPSTILVRAADAHDLVRAARTFEGQLSGAVYGTPADLAGAAALIDVLGRKVGRLIFNGVSTGVEVTPAMNHGGPYPATTDVRSTSVGTAAILRFARPLCYQNATDSLLPAELTDRNVRGIWRLVNNRLTRDDVEVRS
ncbi:MAG TPA: aldehyde dehydrogenase (NADP(+)), partial [Polyangiaceae bacterium]|nr:aldehyde dehydrogenase (NADP(+)) [Polyangiaceae bacterium]